MPKRRVIIYGMDSATFKLMNPLLKAGKLPNINKIISNGSHGVLESVVGCTSASGWATFMTGKNPGKHGIFDWSKQKGYEYDVNYSTDIKALTIWEILSEDNIVSGVINMPLTHPPFKIKGFMISGSPRAYFIREGIHPQSLFDYPEVNKNKITALIAKGIKEDKDQYIREIYSNAKRQFNLGSFLLSKYKNLDVFCIVFTNLDAISHYFWAYQDKNHPLYKTREGEKYRNVIDDYYISLDKKLGLLMEKLRKDDLLFIVSDHGIASSTTNQIYINSWLAEKKLLKIKKNSFRYMGFWLNRFNISISNIVKIFERLKIRDFIDTNFGSTRIVKKSMEILDPLSYIDFSKTKAYYRKVFANQPFDGIEINTKDKNEYDRVRKYIIEEIMKLRDSRTGEKVTEWAKNREEVFKGPHTDVISDIIVKFKDEYSGDPTLNRELFAEHIRTISGEHHLDGIFIASGKGIKKNHKLKNIHLCDVMPTLLHIFGITHSKDVDGKVINDMFDGKVALFKKKKRTAEVTLDIKEAIKDITI